MPKKTPVGLLAAMEDAKMRTWRVDVAYTFKARRGGISSARLQGRVRAPDHNAAQACARDRVRAICRTARTFEHLATVLVEGC